MKCNQSRPGFELVSSCPFPTMITITPRAHYLRVRPCFFLQYPVCLISLIWLVLEMGGRWPWGIFSMICSLLLLFSVCFLIIYLKHPYYCRIATSTRFSCKYIFLIVHSKCFTLIVHSKCFALKLKTIMDFA